METKANYVLVGAFTLAGLVGILLFTLWFARIELDRQFATYEIEFDSVSGLGRASEVRFGGLLVGQVTDLALAPDQSGAIRVVVQVQADTPVRRDSVARIEALGVTGVSYVAIEAGSFDAPLLSADPGEAPPRIIAGPSMLQSLTRGAPELMDEALSVMQRLDDLLGEANRDRVARILDNTESASAALAETLDDLSGTAEAITGVTDEARRFNDAWEALAGRLVALSDRAETTMTRIEALADAAGTTLDSGSDTLQAVGDLVDEADRYMAEEASAASEALRLMLEDLRAEIGLLGPEARRMIDSLATAGDVARTRLDEAAGLMEGTAGALARIGPAVEAAERAAVAIEGVADREIAALSRSARELIARTGRLVDEELAPMLSELRGTGQAMGDLVAALGPDIASTAESASRLARSAESLVAGAADGLAAAEGAMRSLDTAMQRGEAAFASADRTFTETARIAEEEIAPLVADVRSAASGLEAAIGTVSAELPRIGEDLRVASRAAALAFETFAATVARSGAALDGFTAEALPGYARLAQEARALVGNIDRMVGRMDRDPARFLLDDRAPAFRR
ncbi:MlaD family protein [Limimaricola pyoseonensis]|uniref:Phospholipid/cholesterol/gamma-HCH transport system substrate-binding protein n=1 Tax=Limimaricola pyoseonensis TaxID=521013 RepID=A0A1G7JMI5_9RHOB|nr:MlaD family protein [Limimaricola pyoseonensis]SDF25679.1 phospholipid/cholesterol/gamma-HCH transport system substrate-binding protein [Limimaricola pyoseonensis]